MDFDDVHDFDQGENSSRSTSSSAALSSRASSDARTSVRRNNNGVSVAPRLRRRPPPPLSNNNHNNKYSQSEEEDFSVASSSAAASLVVRGAGASSWAVQDAGTVQMLNDECSYLCSAFMSARSTSQALETALELAQLLASKKSRSVLWQSCANSSSSSSSSNNATKDALVASPLSTAAATGSVDDHSIIETKPRSRTVLDAILDVIACVTTTGATISRTPPTTSSSNHSLASSSRSAPVSPSRGARTKSARRKFKQQHLLAPQQQESQVTGTSSSGLTPTWWNQNNNGGLAQLPELAQTLAIIAYYLSLDCTLSKEYSVAGMGGAPKPGTALSIRNSILQHGRALQGMVQLCLQGEKHQRNGKSGRIPSSVPSSGKSSPQRAANNGLFRVPFHANEESSSSGASGFRSNRILNSTLQRKKRRRLGTAQISSNNESSVLASSPAENSLSSLSFGGGDNNNLATSITPKASGGGGGDPTKAGRQNRRRRRLLQADFLMIQKKLPAVPEGNDIDDLDWEGDQILPPPSKRARKQKAGNSATTNLSFSSQEATSNASKEDSSTLFTEPTSPAARREATGSSQTPLSPGERSVASSVLSLDSAGSLITGRLSVKLQQLRSKVHLSSLPGDHGSSLDHEDCDGASQRGDPWVSLVCLESLSRIITGKEGDGASCLAGEQNDDDASPEDDEESNPLLQTNRQLGKNGIIPCLSKCMAQELQGAPLHWEGGNKCNICGEYCKERIAVLASLVDGACLFNKDNRRSFAEDHDPFCFEEDPISSNKDQGLVFSILWFLNNSMPSKMNTLGQSSFEFDTNVAGVRLLALRTLTSLTHDNELAAKQMTVCHKFDEHEGASIEFGGDDEDADSTSSSSIRGIDVLAKLIFELETEPIRSNQKMDGSATFGNTRGDEELHRYDSTIFCLNTLANIIEASDVRRLLAEITVPANSGDQEFWIEWLCKWLVQKTDGFRDAILSIGKEAGSQDSERELEKNEEEKLLAAGNGCVLLACMMMEPDEIAEAPESTSAIRKLIMEQMPLDKDGKTTGVTMLINTLKAFCNFYHFSLGELSLAIVGPVKKLIDGLQEFKE